MSRAAMMFMLMLGDTSSSPPTPDDPTLWRSTTAGVNRNSTDGIIRRVVLSAQPRNTTNGIARATTGGVLRQTV